MLHSSRSASVPHVGCLSSCLWCNKIWLVYCQNAPDCIQCFRNFPGRPQTPAFCCDLVEKMTPTLGQTPVPVTADRYQMISVLINGEDFEKALRAFPLGVSCGPDGITSQRLSKLGKPLQNQEYWCILGCSPVCRRTELVDLKWRWIGEISGRIRGGGEKEKRCAIYFLGWLMKSCERPSRN